MFNIVKSALIPLAVNCKNLRVDRQNKNDINVLESILSENITEKKLKECCNNKEYERTLNDLSLSFNELKLKCVDDNLFAKLFARHVSINSSRQGTKDETYILDICNITAKKLGIEIINLPNTEYRPTKDGNIIDKNTYNKNKYKKNDCLKSFDGKIKKDEKVIGWIFAKITFTNGGHQDNVFEEAHQFAEWSIKYGKEDEIYVLLIDTDLEKQFNELNEKYHKNNILVVNHVDFQKYLIDKYYV
jgi:hypothetical protein